MIHTWEAIELVWQLAQKQRWLIAAGIIMLGNVAAYQIIALEQLTHAQQRGVVIGSILDCVVLVPVFILLHIKKWNVKTVLTVMAAGMLFIRFIIPSALMEPFEVLTWTAIGIEAAFVSIEIILLLLFARYLPGIFHQVKRGQTSMLFTLQKEAKAKGKGNPIVRVLISEILVFYYAFLSWRKPAKEAGWTVYQKTFYVPMFIMLIHAIIIEGIGFHFFFAEKLPLLAWIHKIFSVYGLIFLVADFQALRKNPLFIQHNHLYLSNGLMRNICIDLEDIKQIHDHLEEKKVYHFKALGTTEEKPSFILELKGPQSIHLVGGLTKQVTYIGVYADEPALVKKALFDYKGGAGRW